MKEKTQRGKRRKLPQSLEEVVRMWEKTGIKLPQTFDEFLTSEDGWTQEGGDEQISDDFKTSEGTSLFVRTVNGCEIYLEIPFTTVRVYGRPVIDSVTLFDTDKKRIACVQFKEGEPTVAMTFDERGQANLPLPNAADRRKQNE
jgi:hypothetical protein